VALEKQELRNRLRDAGVPPRERARWTSKLPFRFGIARRLLRLVTE